MDELKSESMFSELHGEIGASGHMGTQRRLADYRAQVGLERQELLDQLKAAGESATAASDAHDKEKAGLARDLEIAGREVKMSHDDFAAVAAERDTLKTQLTDLQKKLEALTPAHA